MKISTAISYGLLVALCGALLVTSRPAAGQGAAARTGPAIPRTADGESLADFQLNTRLFKNRCSYMIYSEAFRGLPAAVKSRVIAGLRKILESPVAEDRSKSITVSERQRIVRILRGTGIW